MAISGNKKIPAVVGIIQRMEIWETVRQEGWYHIPVKSAPRNILRCRYLAYYFTKLFNQDLRYQVIHYSEILSIERHKRIELFPQAINHPKADLYYYKLNLGSLQTLPKPIPSRLWRRIIFIPTSLEKLQQAKEINDLYDTSPLEEAMYDEMKRMNIQVHRQLYVPADDKRYYLDFGIFCREGKIDVECDGETYHNLPNAYTKDRKRNNELTSHGWRILRFGTKDIKHDINGCMSIIRKTIDLLGGIEDHNDIKPL